MTRYSTRYRSNKIRIFRLDSTPPLYLAEETCCRRKSPVKRKNFRPTDPRTNRRCGSRRWCHMSVYGDSVFTGNVFRTDKRRCLEYSRCIDCYNRSGWMLEGICRDIEGPRSRAPRTTERSVVALLSNSLAGGFNFLLPENASRNNPIYIRRLQGYGCRLIFHNRIRVVYRQGWQFSSARFRADECSLP